MFSESINHTRYATEGPLFSLPCGHSSMPVQLSPCHGQEVDEWGHLRPCMKYIAEVQCHRNSRHVRIHCRPRAAPGSHQMQVSGRKLAVLVGQVVEAAGARPRRANISMVLGIGAMRRSRVRGCCPTRQENDLGENFREERVGNMNGIPLPNPRQTPWAVYECLLPIHG